MEELQPIVSPELTQPQYPEPPTVQHVEVLSTSKKSRTPLLILLLMVLSVGVGAVIWFSKDGSISMRKVLPPASTNADLAPELPANPEASMKSEVNNSEVFFIRDDVLYKLSPLHAEPTAYVKKAFAYAFSPDHTKLAYIPGYGPDEDNDIRIRTLSDESEVVISTGKDSTNRRLEWSPKGTYLLVDAGTGPEGSYSTFDAKTGKYFVSFGDGAHAWFDEKHIYISDRVLVDPPRPWGAGEGANLSSLDVTTGQSDAIQKADATTNYQVEEIDSNCLHYTKETVKDPADWENQNAVIRENFCLDLTTAKAKVVDGKSNNVDAKAETALKLANSETYTYTNFVYNETYPDWVVASLDNGGSIYGTQIVLFNMTDPKATYRELTKGAYVSWH